MKTFIVAMVTLLMSTTANAHEWTPTYPKFSPSFLEGVVTTTMTLFNKRKDIDYYEVSVFDKDWKTIPFATNYKIVNVPYLSRKTIKIYLREIDCDRIEYICTSSKRVLEDGVSSGIDSRICSKV